MFSVPIVSVFCNLQRWCIFPKHWVSVSWVSQNSFQKLVYEKQSYTQWVFKMVFPMKTVKLASLSDVSKEHNGKVIYLNASVLCSICISFPAHLIGKIYFINLYLHFLNFINVVLKVFSEGERIWVFLKLRFMPSNQLLIRMSSGCIMILFENNWKVPWNTVLRTKVEENSSFILSGEGSQVPIGSIRANS